MGLIETLYIPVAIILLVISIGLGVVGFIMLKKSQGDPVERDRAIVILTWSMVFAFATIAITIIGASLA